MKSTTASGLLLAGAVWLVGCGVAGRWRLHTFEPESARGDFDLTELTLRSDGTYALAARCGGQERQSTGAYAFEGGRLTLRPAGDGAPQRVYEAELTDLGSRLKVRTERAGAPIVAVLKRR